MQSARAHFFNAGCCLPPLVCARGALVHERVCLRAWGGGWGGVREGRQEQACRTRETRLTRINNNNNNNNNNKYL
jgi:hypothetical protein